MGSNALLVHRVLVATFLVMIMMATLLLESAEACKTYVIKVRIFNEDQEPFAFPDKDDDDDAVTE